MSPGGGRVKPNEPPADGDPEAASPFPPAFRWDAATQDAPTQVMAPIGRDPASPFYQQSSTEAQDLFQPVDPGHGTHPEANESPAPPWADSDLSPIAEQQSAWLRQGPEVFQTPATGSRSKQIIGIAVLAVVVLGLVGATVAYFLTTGPGRTGNPQLAAPAPLPPPVDTAHALVDPPGQLRGGGGLFDVPTLLAETSPPLASPILKALQAGGMTDGVLKATTTGGTTVGLFALTMPDQQTATTVAQDIATAQLDGGLKADDNRALQGMAVMASAPGEGSATYRAVYVLYNRAIFIDVSGPNREAVQATFDALVKQQVTHAPPTVRVGH